MQKTLLLGILCLLTGMLWGQSKRVSAEAVLFPHSQILSDNFYNYRVVNLNTAELHRMVQAQGTHAEVRLRIGGDAERLLQLERHDLRAAGYTRRVGSERGVQDLPSREVGTYRGQLAGPSGKKLSLVIEPDFCFGLWTEGDETWFIEPLYRLEPSADKALYLVYRERDIKPVNNFCGLSMTRSHERELQHKPADEEKLGNCLITEIALAADNSIRLAFGGVAGAENFMFGVLNNVQTNYDNEFADEVQFTIITTFVSTCSTCDPWSTTTNAGDLLDSFAAWGNGNGFGTVGYDVASLWTNRDLAGTTIGVAWLGGLCTELRYNLLQNFSSNAAFLRVLQSHELGHNFNANHDAEGSNTIMAPSVNSSNAWSNNSRTEINNFLEDSAEPFGCLASCSPPLPPIAQIVAPITEVCPGSYVAFFDASTNSPGTWNWSFPGGDPSSSTSQHPVVFYETPGVYPVTLTVQNAAGADATALNSDIIVGDGGRKYLMNETFEEGTSSSWSISNPDNSVGWTFSNVSGNNGRTAMYVNNFDYQGGTGQIDALVSPILNFSEEQEVLLEFEYAYRRYNANLNDRMIVRLSTNGGASYPNILFNAQENGSGNFATGPDTQNAFFPQSAADWCFQGPSCIALDLSAYSGQSNVRIRIENVSGFGNNLFVDNIRLSSACEPILPPVAAFIATNTSGCTPLTVSFTDQSEGAESLEWYFPGGNPDFSVSPNPVVVYNTPGEYTVTLIATNTTGSTSVTEAAYVSVQGPPTPDFAIDGSGMSFNFDNLTNGGDFFQWTFGDGSESFGANASHTYTEPGTYTVRLTASNGCGSAYIEKTVVAISPLSAAFTADTTSGCAGLQVQFTDQSIGSPTAWAWSFPGGSPASATAPNPLVTYAQPGTYTVSLIVTLGMLNDTLIQTGYIVIPDTPVAAFTATVPIGSPLASFTNTSTGATTASWTFGDGSSSTAANPTHTYAAAGTYTVTLIAGNSCGSDTTSQVITVVLPPVAGLTASATQGCAPLSVSYAASPQGPGLSYVWTFPGGEPAASTDANPTVVYAQPGSYGATLIVTNAAGSDTATQASLVSALAGPTAAFSTAYTAGSLNAAFSHSATGASSYSWAFGDGGSSAEPNPTHTYAAAGDYTVTLIVTNSCGADTASQVLTVILPPVATFTASTNQGCAPLSVSYAASPQGPGLSYAWSFPGGQPATSTDASPTVVYAQPGSYGATLIVINAAGSDTTTQAALVSVLTGPTAAFSTVYTVGSLNAAFSHSATGASNYSWAFGDGGSSAEPNPTHTYAAAGNYTVNLIVTNACGADTASQVLTVILPPVATFTASINQGCVPLSVSYAASPQGSGLSYAWTFPGGEPATSTDANPTVVYALPGSYGATLIVTNAAGSDTTTQAALVSALTDPTAAFSTAYTAGSLNAAFSHSATGASSYSWAFGDGGSSAEPNPTHAYATAGDYTVTLIVSNACGADTASQVLTVILPPVATFTASTTQGCAPLSVSYAASPQGPGLSYAWSFPGGEPATSTDANPTVVYAQPGSYDVVLNVSNVGGTGTATLSNYITALGLPTAAFTQNTNGSLVQFFSAAQAAQTHFWDFGDGNTSSELNPEHHYQMPGDYSASLIVSNTCGSDTLSSTISINGNAPLVAFSATGNQGCAPLTVQFTNQSTGANTFLWSFPGGVPSSSTDEHPVVTYPTAGVYDVILTAGNAFGNSALNRVGLVVVSAGPQAGFSFEASSITSYSFTNSSTNATTYFWDFGDGTPGSSMISPMHTYTNGGSFTVSLVAINACGSDTTTQTIVILGQAPVAAFTTDTREGCAPLAVQFTDASTGQPTAWQWSFPGGSPAASTQQNPLVTYTQPGQYDATLIVFNALGSDTFTLNGAVEILAAPNVSSISITPVNPQQWDNLAFTLEGTATGSGLTYTWIIAELDTLRGNPVNFTFPGEGLFSITLIVSSDCGEVRLSDELGILFPAAKEPVWAKGLTISPNPGYGHFVLQAEAWEGSGLLEADVFDPSGRLIQRAAVVTQPGRWQHSLDLSQLPAGTYLLRLGWQGQLWGVRLLKF